MARGNVCATVSVLLFPNAPRKSGPTDFLSSGHTAERKSPASNSNAPKHKHTLTTDIYGWCSVLGVAHSALNPGKEKRGRGGEGGRGTGVCVFATGEDSTLARLNCTLPCVWHHYKLRSHLLQAHRHASCMYKTSCSRNTYKNTRIVYQHATSMFVCFYPSKQILAILTAKLCRHEPQIHHWHSPWIPSQLHYCTCARGLLAPANPKQPPS